MVGNLRKIVKNIVIRVGLYNKQNITWLLGTLEDKLHISAQPSNILYIFLNRKLTTTLFKKKRTVNVSGGLISISVVQAVKESLHHFWCLGKNRQERIALLFVVVVVD
ncbi:hypothetical protein ACROYT_G033752, partial [Oculina patagonica]